MREQSIAIIIPARAGSKRIPHKNTIDFLGQPMLAYPIALAKNLATMTKLPLSIYVSSDADETLALASSLGAIPLKREDALASDTATTIELMSAVCKGLQNGELQNGEVKGANKAGANKGANTLADAKAGGTGADKAGVGADSAGKLAGRCEKKCADKQTKKQTKKQIDRLDDSDLVICLYPATPLLRPSILLQAIELFTKLQSTTIPPDFMLAATAYSHPVQRAFTLEVESNFIQPISIKEAPNAPESQPQSTPLLSLQTQALATYYHDAGQFYIGLAKSFIKGLPIIGAKTACIILDELTTQDIDEPSHLALAAMKYRLMHGLE